MRPDAWHFAGKVWVCISGPVFAAPGPNGSTGRTNVNDRPRSEGLPGERESPDRERQGSRLPKETPLYPAGPGTNPPSVYSLSLGAASAKWSISIAHCGVGGGPEVP